MMRRAPLLMLMLLLIGPPAHAAEDAIARSGAWSEDALPVQPSARQVIERAFQNFYYFDEHSQIEFDVRSRGRAVLHYETEMMRKFIDGRAHQLFYFEGDGDMRGRRVLRIERTDRADDAFVYLPQLRRIRRNVMAQRADKLMGMEVTLEDLEIQRLEKSEILGSSFSNVAGEPAHIVTLRRLFGGAYDRADFFIASSDYAMLEVRFYRSGALEPFKVTEMRRETMQHYAGHVLPSRIDFIDREQGTETTLFFTHREVDPELRNDRFTTLALEKRQRLSWMRTHGAEAED